MAQNHKYNQIHLVGLSSYKDNINAALLSRANKVFWHNNVYEALADLIINNCPGPNDNRTAVFILIDALDKNQMQFFQCLADFKHIHTLAISSNEDHEKLKIAKDYGAKAKIKLDLLLKKTPKISFKPAKIIHKIDNYAKSNIVKSHIFEQMNQTRLTDKELYDLLGRPKT